MILINYSIIGTKILVFVMSLLTFGLLCLWNSLTN